MIGSRRNIRRNYQFACCIRVGHSPLWNKKQALFFIILSYGRMLPAPFLPFAIFFGIM